MKRTPIILFITAVIFLFAAVTFLNSADNPKLTPEYLASGNWVIPGVEDCTGTAKFSADGRFTLLSKCGHTEDWLDASGSYKINGNTVTIKVEQNKETSGIKKGYTCRAVFSDDNSLKYRWYLAFDNPSIGRVHNYNSIIKEGDTVSIGGLDAVSTGDSNGKVKTNLKIREKPDSSAKEIHYTVCDSFNSDKSETFKSIPKGTDLPIYARTREKVKVGKWTNYWYYVSLAYDNCEGGGYIYGWVFGEFVKIK